MAGRLTVVISQGQSASPIKRKLEEDLVAALLFERGLEVTVVPHLYDLAPDGTGMLCLQGIAGDMLVLSWLYPRAARWTLDRNGIRGREGSVLLTVNEGEEDEEDDADIDKLPDEKARVVDARDIPARSIFCLDFRAAATVEPFVHEICRIRDETAVKTVELLSWVSGPARPEALDRYLAPGAGAVPPPRSSDSAQQPAGPANGQATDSAGESPLATSPNRVEEQSARRWYPVIDYSRCTNCMECIDFCLFGVYGLDGAETILVEQPDNCRKGCPACSRVCPENAIIFPQHKTPAIAGSPVGQAGDLKIDLSKLFGAPDAVQVAVLERDVELVAVGRDAVGDRVGLRKRAAPAGPKDELDKLMDQLDSFNL